VGALGDLLVNQVKSISTIGALPFSIKLYDAQKPPPSYPVWSHVEGTGSIDTAAPNELALCLSYYAGYNRPRFRGRLYIPFTLIGGTTQKRPSASQMTLVAEWAKLFRNLPSPWIGCVYSRRAGAAYAISNWWVDDEWDVMRSRGLKPTTRQTGTLP
jgi:hypothetical protein